MQLPDDNSKVEILSKAKLLKGTSQFINQDFSTETQRVHRKLSHYMWEARREGHKAFLNYNKLIVNGESFSESDYPEVPLPTVTSDQCPVDRSLQLQEGSSVAVHSADNLVQQIALMPVLTSEVNQVSLLPSVNLELQQSILPAMVQSQKHDLPIHQPVVDLLHSLGISSVPVQGECSSSAREAECSTIVSNPITGTKPKVLNSVPSKNQMQSSRVLRSTTNQHTGSPSREEPRKKSNALSDYRYSKKK